MQLCVYAHFQHFQLARKPGHGNTALPSCGSREFVFHYCPGNRSQGRANSPQPRSSTQSTGLAARAHPSHPSTPRDCHPLPSQGRLTDRHAGLSHMRVGDFAVERLTVGTKARRKGSPLNSLRLTARAHRNVFGSTARARRFTLPGSPQRAHRWPPGAPQGLTARPLKMSVVAASRPDKPVVSSR